MAGVHDHRPQERHVQAGPDAVGRTAALAWLAHQLRWEQQLGMLRPTETEATQTQRP